ncbi:Leishmanolysin-like peptidase [Chionoecetes opilio]|uniref:Leishmanolysin-like peptidase n=1 Tax=Chionoecetes opilio TaxID=41210 RepID=A0A8J4XQ91_CHIOP|nr:Leishmanolysin-like peptidase [Chionoecetes opilio]
MFTADTTHIWLVFVLCITITTCRIQPNVAALRVHVEYVDEGFTLRTQDIVRQAVLYVTRLLSVVDDSSSSVFHVPREKNSCLSVYFEGLNAGKCGQISHTNLEFCGVAPIPPAHLQGLHVFSGEEVEPLPASLPQGLGFTDGTNFVVYLTLRESELCASSLAHSQVCRKEAFEVGGVLSGRPVAGTVNVCWKEGEIEAITIRRVVIHELLHLLGMNYRSMREFVECEGKGRTKMCWKMKDVIRVTLDGEVVVWSRHFRRVIRRQKICEKGRHRQSSCTSRGCPPQACVAYNGLILENLTRSVNMHGGIAIAKSRTGVHWPEELFDDPSSVMVPKHVESGHVTVDPLTLALLRTSGWYWVNHTVLPCLNHFLNVDSLSLNCSNLLEKENDSTDNNRTETRGETNIQSPPSGSPMNASSGHEPTIASKGEAGTLHSTIGPNKITWIKQQMKEPSGERVSEGRWLGQAGRRALTSSTPTLTTAQPAEMPQELPGGIFCAL